MEHILNLPLDRKGSSYQDLLFLCETQPREVLCTLPGPVVLWGYIGFLPPPRAGTKILEVLSPSAVFAAVPSHTSRSPRHI